MGMKTIFLGSSEPGLGLFAALFRGQLFDGWFRRSTKGVGLHVKCILGLSSSSEVNQWQLFRSN
jgi:hypothetical protein